MSNPRFSAGTLPVVSLHDGRPATTSLEVAKFFGKRHDAVLRDLRNLYDNLPKTFCAHNFVETYQIVQMPNGGTRTETVFTLYRDAVTILVMGYTGNKALRFKLAYIEAFNKMEAQLARQQKALSSPSHITLRPGHQSTWMERKPLAKLIHAWSKLTGIPIHIGWSQVTAHFNIVNPANIPTDKIPEAIAFVQSRIDMLNPEPHLQTKLRQSNHAVTKLLSAIIAYGINLSPNINPKGNNNITLHLED